MRNLTRSSFAAAALLVLGMAACGIAFKEPEVRFEGMRLGGLGIRGGTIYAQIHVVNPNRFALQTAALSYDLEVGGDATNGGAWQRLATGTFSEPIRVEANDSAVVEIPIDFDYAQVGGAFRAIVDRGTFDYRVSGIVQVREPIRREVPYRRTGRVSVTGAR